MESITTGHDLCFVSICLAQSLQGTDRVAKLGIFPRDEQGPNGMERVAAMDTMSPKKSKRCVQADFRH